MSLPGLYLSGNKRYKKTSNSSLDGFTPLSMLDTELGAETELDTLERFTNEKGRQLHVVSGLYRVVWWWNADSGSNSLSQQVGAVSGVCPLVRRLSISHCELSLTRLMRRVYDVCIGGLRA